MQIAVIGAADASAEEYATACAVGALIASWGTLVCGGLGGVMEAACKRSTGARWPEGGHPAGYG